MIIYDQILRSVNRPRPTLRMRYVQPGGEVNDTPDARLPALAHGGFGLSPRINFETGVDFVWCGVDTT